MREKKAREQKRSQTESTVRAPHKLNGRGPLEQGKTQPRAESRNGRPRRRPLLDSILIRSGAHEFSKTTPS